MNRGWTWTVVGCAAMFVTACGLMGGPHTPSHTSTHAQVVVSSDSSSARTTSDTWDGLSLAPASLVQTLETAQVDTASGEAVKLPLDRPVVVFAPWCEYCHRLEQMLSREGLLDQATWVAAGFEIYEYPITQNATTTRSLLTLAEAEQKVKASYAALHLPMPTHVLYAMPGTPLAEAVRGYPDVFVLHDGRWYLQPGYVDAPGFWKTILA